MQHVAGRPATRCVPPTRGWPATPRRRAGSGRRRGRTRPVPASRGSTTASRRSWTIEGRSSTSKTRSKLTSAVITSMRTLDRPCSGPSSRSSRVARASSVPTVSVPSIARWPPNAVDERRRQGRDQHQAGAEDARDQGDPDPEVTHHAGLLREQLVLLGASAEQLEQQGPTDVEPLGHRVAEVGVALHLLTGQPGQPAPHPPGRRAGGREERQAQQRDLPAQGEHGDAHQDQADAVGDGAGQRRGERPLGADHVVVEPGHQRSGLGAREEGQRHPLHVPEHARCGGRRSGPRRSGRRASPLPTASSASRTATPAMPSASCVTTPAVALEDAVVDDALDQQRHDHDHAPRRPR